jgi:sterol desaturase/sphingolipid hydroxylase (fatty acid hydroxylase superfamily)
MDLSSITNKTLLISTVIFWAYFFIEAAYSYVKKDKVYQLRDTLSNIVTSTSYQLIRRLWLAPVFAGALVLTSKLSPWSWSMDSVFAWFACFILVDFMYYWDHRLGHETNLLWAFHNIHHSSEKFNLAVAARLSWVEEVYRWIFLAPLALLGLPVPMILLVKVFHRIYQFPVHSEYIGKLGILEYVLATPSQHRVHHARNPQYLDKNYGGVLCIWDRLFGTFCPEVEKVEYGLVKQINTFNPIKIQLIGPQRLWAELQAPVSFGKKLKHLFKKPGSYLE